MIAENRRARAHIDKTLIVLVFGLALFDRGSEFDAIEGMEASCLHAGKRLDAYFTDPSRPDQKGRCERLCIQAHSFSYVL